MQIYYLDGDLNVEMFLMFGLGTDNFSTGYCDDSSTGSHSCHCPWPDPAEEIGGREPGTWQPF